MYGQGEGFGFLLQGGEELCAQGGGKGGDRTQKVTIKEPPKNVLCGQKNPFFNGTSKAIFENFYVDRGKKFSGHQARGVNKVSCRRGGVTVPFAPTHVLYGKLPQVPLQRRLLLPTPFHTFFAMRYDIDWYKSFLRNN